MTLTTTLFHHGIACWLVLSISLASCCMPALASEAPEDLPPGYQNSPILTSVKINKQVYPLAWYNLLITSDIPDVQFEIYNPTLAVATVRLTSQYLGYSDPTVNVAKIYANSTSTFNQSVILDLEKIREIRTTTRANLYYKIEYWDDGNWVIHDEQTYPITIYPMNQMIWAIEDPNGTVSLYHGLIATFVTPQSRGVTDLLTKAKERATSDVDEGYAKYGLERQLPGYSRSPASYSDAENYTNLQVKAIYNALKYDYNLSYVDAPVAFGIGDSQRVSTPDESLSSGSANCIDGSVLFASALERIGMRPYIVIAPGHAYVAWDTDIAGGGWDALETTWVSGHDFEEANDAGRKEFDEDFERMWLYQDLLNSEISREQYSSLCILVDIDWLRKSEEFLPALL